MERVVGLVGKVVGGYGVGVAGGEEGVEEGVEGGEFCEGLRGGKGRWVEVSLRGRRCFRLSSVGKRGWVGLGWVGAGGETG